MGWVTSSHASSSPANLTFHTLHRNKEFFWKFQNAPIRSIFKLLSWNFFWWISLARRFEWCYAIWARSILRFGRKLGYLEKRGWARRPPAADAIGWAPSPSFSFATLLPPEPKSFGSLKLPAEATKKTRQIASWHRLWLELGGIWVAIEPLTFVLD